MLEGDAERAHAADGYPRDEYSLPTRHDDSVVATFRTIQTRRPALSAILSRVRWRVRMCEATTR